MQTKRIKRVLLSFLLLSVLYNLLVASLSQWKINLHSNKKTKTPTPSKSTKTPTAQATHIPMPSILRGKKLPFHQVFEPRPVALFRPANVSKNNTKLILLWTRWNSIKRTINYYFLQPGKKTFLKHNCPNPNCVATFNRKKLGIADAVLFHLIDIKTDDLPATRSPNQVWILYNMEPPWQVQKHMASKLNFLSNLFNWTMSYRSNSDIVVTYGIVLQSEDNTASKISDAFDKKTKSIAWFVSDCHTDSKREDYVKELKKHIDIDVYGKCGKKKCYPSQSSNCYEVLNDYKFYLSFENAICKDYVTEKFFNVFNQDVIPVVYGGVNYSTLVPRESFIDATQYAKPQVLADTLTKIGNNRTLYEGFLKKKGKFKAYLDPWMCRLCDKLHIESRTSSVKNIENWFLKDSHCKQWNSENQGFVRTLV